MSYQNPRLSQYREFLKGKSASVIGVGISNIPLIEFLLKNDVRVTARDAKDFSELCEINPKVKDFREQGVNFVLGENYLSDIKEDIVYKSPGIRYDKEEIVKAVENGSLITSEMEAFLSLCPSKIIAVTGSDGKTTTTTLIAKILEAAGKKVWLGGNIGWPLLSEIENIMPDDFTVLELSSFQLHTINKFENNSLPFAKIEFPDVAVVTNVSPNHLNWHTDMDEYTEAKKAVFTYIREGGVLVTNIGNDITSNFGNEAKLNGIKTRMFSVKNTNGNLHLTGDTIYYGTKPVIDASDILLPGKHNIENYMAAIGATYDFVTPEDVKKVATSFGGVEHRLEYVRTVKGVKYYNGSIDSSPARTLAALSAFGPEYKRKIVLMLGGKDKNLDFSLLADVICKKVKAVFISHDTEEQKVYNTIVNNENYDKEKLNVEICDGFDDNFRRASEFAEEGDIVLLSPAMTSFDEFRNFEMRGKRFKSLVADLRED
ncbi:MAG: UDP-N-acetylmuramoyl-L-alanine--D-glutamate ligase [Clostridia bacterium]|nr:UDP-N-acetylmuramoyl-L-alanine--D-glutamate ligase [Clostridia bacterium]